MTAGFTSPWVTMAATFLVRKAIGWSRSRLTPILSAAILFLVIWATMYTAFGKYPGDWLAIPKAVKYWMGQHSIARIPGPWYYYFPQLAYYDTAILLAAGCEGDAPAAR